MKLHPDMELVHIAQGWYNFITGSPEVKQMMNRRLAICDSCPHKVEISPLGKKILKALNEKASTYVCGLCGCPLSGLTAAPKKRCKAGKWGPDSPSNSSQSNSYYD